MLAFVLAGGYGTRLRPLTYTRPKPMVPIADRPILHYIISSLASQGFERIVVTTSYLYTQIENYFGDGSRYGVRIYYSREEIPLGTAGGVKKARKFATETFAVIQGDNITSISLAEEMKYHKRKGGIATLAVKPVEEPWRYGVVEVDERKRIVRFKEKPPPEECFSNLVSVGLYVIEPEALDYVPEGREFDFAKDLFPLLLKEGYELYAYETDEFWVDIGSLPGYMAAKDWILSKQTRRVSEKASIGNAEIRGNVRVEAGAVIGDDCVIEGPAFIGAKARIENGCWIGPGTTVGSGTKIGPNSEIKGSAIFEYVSVGEKAKLDNCVVAEGCCLGDRVEVEEMAIIGPECTIGSRTKVTKGSRIWPSIRVGEGSVIKGTLLR